MTAQMERAFDDGTKILVEMSEEIELLKKRYGDHSHFVVKKQDALRILVDMQAKAVETIDLLYKMNYMREKQYEIANNMAELLIANHIVPMFPLTDNEQTPGS